MDYLYIAGFVQTIFFSLLLISKKRKHPKDYILLCFILLIGFQLFFVYASHTDWYANHAWLYIIDFLYWTLLGPVLFIYVKLATSAKDGLNIKLLLHFTPFLIVVFSFSDFILYYMEKENFEAWLPYNNNIFTNLAGFIWAWTSPIYYLASIYYIYKHQKKIKNYFSNTKNVDLKWLKYLTNGFAVFLFGEVILIVLEAEFHISVSTDFYNIEWLPLILYVFGIGFFGYKQKGIFSENEHEMEKTKIMTGNDFEKAINSNGNKDNKGKYQKSGLDEIESEKIKNQLITLMEEKKPYLDSALNLPILADILQTSPNKLSQVLNSTLNKTFFDFVNEYRVNELIKYFKEPKYDNLKINHLAFECGFNSISTFYAFFKKTTSSTPSGYRNQLKIHLEKPVKA